MQIQRFGFHQSLGSVAWLMIAVVLMAGAAASAQTLTPLWVKQGQGAGDDYALATYTSGNGYNYSAGVFLDELVLAEGEPNETTLSDAVSGLDGFLITYNGNGSLINVEQISLGNNVQVSSMVFDNALNLYMVGTVNGSHTFGAGQEGAVTVSSRGAWDAFIAKYDVNGDVQWVNLLGGSLEDYGRSVAVNSLGEVVFGAERNNADGSSSTLIGVYDSNGAGLWGAEVNPQGSNQFRNAGAVAIDDESVVYLLSQQRPATGLYTDATLTLQKYDASGSVLWTTDVTGHRPGPMKIFGDGVVMGNRLVQDYQVGQPAYSDYVLEAIGGDGSVLWTEYGTGNESQRITDISVTSDAVYITGHFQSNITMGAGHDNETTLSAQGFYDPFLAKYNNEGTFYWAHHVSRNMAETHFALHVRNNQITLSGGFYQDFTIGGTTLTSQTMIDQFSAQYQVNDPVISGVTFFYPSYTFMKNVTLTFSGLGSVQSNDEGFYSMHVPYGWSGTVTPSAVGYTFGDTSHTYVNVTEDQTIRDFWETSDPVVEVSGHVVFSPSAVPIENVEIEFSNGGGTATTDSLGAYAIVLPYDWTGTATPSYEGFVFDPLTRDYDALTQFEYDQDYAVNSAAEVSISGKVFFSPGQEAVEGALIEASGTSVSFETGADGLFSVRVPYRWTGQLTVSKTGYDFEPSFRYYNQLLTNPVDQDFWVAGKPLVTISGRLLGLSGQGIEGATVSNGAGMAVTTDADGYYELEVDFAWSGTVTPTFGDYLFVPASRSYTALTADSTNHDYQTLGPAQILITGTVLDPVGAGVEDAVLTYGQDSTAVTNADGEYTITVDNGWGGTVSIDKDDLIFSPLTRTYTALDTHQTAQNYDMLGPANISITGRVLDTGGQPIDMVRLTWGNPVDTTYTGADGNYEIVVPFDWAGTVTPYKEGHEFTPENRSYEHLRNHRSNQDYNLAGTPMFDISGNIAMYSGGPAAGVMVIVGDHLDTAYTDVSGNYSFQVALGFTGDITPENGDWLFDPESIALADVAQHQSGHDFTAMGPATITISGKTYFQGGGEPISGVVIKWGSAGDSVVTGADGLYSFTVANGWSGTVTPGKLNYDMDPSSRTYATLRDHQANQDFWVQGKPELTIAGRIVDRSGSGVPQMAVFYSDSDSVLTDNDGDYVVTVPFAWSGTVVPKDNGDLFDPENRSYSVLTTDMTGQNFTNLGPINAVISGRLYYHPSGDPIVGAILRWGVEGDSVLTDADGEYAIQVENEWSGTVVPEKPGHHFDPTFRPHSNVVTHLPNQDFWVNAPSTVTISGLVTNPGDSAAADVVLKYSETDSVFSDEDGLYEITVPYGWSGTVVPVKDDWYINPVSRDYTVLTASLGNQNYQLLGPAVIELSGQVVTANGAGVSQAVVFYGISGDSVLTDGSGQFVVTVDYGWSGSLRPEKSGLAFDPPQRSVTTVSDHVGGLNFTAFNAGAPRVLIVADGPQNDVLTVLNSLQYFHSTQNALPTDITTYDLVIYGDSTAAVPGHLSVLPGYVSGGGAVLLMDLAPMALVGNNTDLTPIAAWFGASLQRGVTLGDAVAAVPQPFGTAINQDDVLITLSGDTAYAVSALNDETIVLGRWEEYTNTWQSVIKVHNAGKSAYWSRLRLDDAENLALYTAMIQWLISDETAVDEDLAPGAIPASFDLLPAYPNPFNPSTTVTYDMAQSGEVKIEVFDLRGRRVTVLEDGMQSAGRHKLEWLARDDSGRTIASGMYFIRMTAGDQVNIQKVIFLK